MKTTFWCLLCFTLATLTIGAQNNQTQSPINVSFRQLISTSTQFDGNRISIVGYFNGTDGASLRASPSSGPQAQDVFLDLKPRLARRLAAQRFLKGYVHIVGTFQHMDLAPFNPRPVPGDPNRVIVTQPQGFGGGYANQITNISEFTAISHPKN
jgi:hypothetical protein